MTLSHSAVTRDDESICEPACSSVEARRLRAELTCLPVEFAGLPAEFDGIVAEQIYLVREPI